jgi:hypothetical protein
LADRRSAWSGEKLRALCPDHPVLRGRDGTRTDLCLQRFFFVLVEVVLVCFVMMMRKLVLVTFDYFFFNEAAARSES